MGGEDLRDYASASMSDQLSRFSFPQRLIYIPLKEENLDEKKRWGWETTSVMTQWSINASESNIAAVGLWLREKYVSKKERKGEKEKRYKTSERKLERKKKLTFFPEFLGEVRFFVGAMSEDKRLVHERKECLKES